MRIRAALPNEAKMLTNLSLRSKAHWGYSSDFIEQCRDEMRISERQINSDEHFFRLAEIDNQVVGFYSLRRKLNDDLELDALFVDPESMGQGVGSSLLGHAKELVGRFGKASFVVQSDPNASGFYEREGGKKVGERESGSVANRMLPLFEITV